MSALFHDRLKIALAASRATPALTAGVMGEVDAFFAAHPEEPRTEASVALLFGIVLERLQTEAGESPSATRQAA